jgi:hypothetical protein
LEHFHLLIEQKKYRITQDDGKKSQVEQQPNLRREQLLKGLGSIFYTGREITQNELLDIESLGSDEDEHFSGCIRALLMAKIDFASLSRIQSQLLFWINADVIWEST